MMEQISFLLASGSPRRQTMLTWLDLHFQAQPVDIDESPWPGEAPDRYACRLAEGKATAAANSFNSELILAADTIVADGNELLGKPVDAEEAEKMLRQLRGRTHQVYTALALYQPATGRLSKDLCISQVPMRHFSDEEMSEYIASGDPMDKAGAYGIQHPDFKPVTSLKDCYASVMGLPLCHLARTLHSFDFSLNGSTPQTCQTRLGYICTVYPQILPTQQERDDL